MVIKCFLLFMDNFQPLWKANSSETKILSHKKEILTKINSMETCNKKVVSWVWPPHHVPAPMWLKRTGLPIFVTRKHNDPDRNNYVHNFKHVFLAVLKQFSQMLVKSWPIRESRRLLLIMTQTAASCLEALCDYCLDTLVLQYLQQRNWLKIHKNEKNKIVEFGFCSTP